MSRLLHTTRLLLLVSAIALTASVGVWAQDVLDSSGYGHDGTLVGLPPTLVDDGSGPFGSYYLRLNGGQISAGSVSDWGLGGSYSISMWFEGYDIDAQNANGVLASSYADGTVPGFGLYFQGAGTKVNQVGYYHVNQISPFTYNSVQDTQNLSSGWHHVAAIFEQGVGSSLYIDGNFIGTDVAVTSGISSLTQQFMVGGQDYSTPRPFQNGIDEVKLFDRALTAADVQSLYTNNTASGAILNWNCNSLGPVAPDIPDLSGNSHDGSYSGPGVSSINDGTGPHGGYLLDDGTAMATSTWAPNELTGSYTVAGWFEGHDAASINEVVFSSYADGSVPGFVLQFVGDPRHGNDQLVYYHISTTSPFAYNAVKSPESYGDGWHHTAIVFEEGVGSRLYVDGEKVGEATTVTAGISDFTKEFVVGGQQWSQPRPFHGGIDEVMAFDRALSDQEIRDLYSTNAASGALLHWAFDAVPEPGTIVLIAIGLLTVGLGWQRRK